MERKVRCTAITRAGKPCKAWAIAGSNPPLCSAHAGRNVGAGPPPGNQNARKHGYYSHRFTTQELADLVPHAQPQLAFALFFAALPLVLIPLLIGWLTPQMWWLVDVEVSCDRAGRDPDSHGPET